MADGKETLIVHERVVVKKRPRVARTQPEDIPTTVKDSVIGTTGNYLTPSQIAKSKTKEISYEDETDEFDSSFVGNDIDDVEDPQMREFLRLMAEDEAKRKL
jgi:hypothetical protein